jgi:hypothetical protein
MEEASLTILALDPGNTQTGYAVIEMPEFRLVEFGKIDNKEMLGRIVRSALPPVDTVAVEMVASYGMAVGREVFETCVWIGRFHQAAGHPNTHYVYRKEEKEILCGSLRAKDANIRQALIDRYARHDLKNGKGTKANPDVFYGVSKDVWAAIAVGVTYYESSKLNES